MEETNQTAHPDDVLIRQKVIDVLHKEPSLDAVKVVVEVHDGIVVLKGTIDTEAEKKLSEELAKKIDGVKSVENHLHIDVGIAHALSFLAAHIQSDIIKDDEPDEKDEKK